MDRSDEVTWSAESLSLGVLSRLSHGVLVRRSDGLVVGANSAAGLILGLTTEELVGPGQTEILWTFVPSTGTTWAPEPGPGGVFPPTSDVFERVVDALVGLVRPDGVLVWLSWSNCEITLPDGTTGALVEFVDVTSLRQLEQRQRLLFEHSGAAGAVLDLRSGAMLDVNEEMCRWLGYSRENLIGRPAHILFEPDDVGLLSDRVGLLERGQQAGFESRFRRRNGSIRWGVVSARGVPRQHGDSTVALFHVIDITEAKQATEAWSTGWSLYLDTVEAMRDPLFLWGAVVDGSGSVMDFDLKYVNAAGGVAVGKNPSQVIGERLTRLFPSMIDSGSFERFVGVIDTGEPLLSETVQPFELARGEFESHVVRSGDKLVVVMRDVTVRNRIARELDEKQRRYRLLAEYAGDVVIHKSGGLIEWIGPSVTALLGWLPEELIGTRTIDIIHPDDHYLLAQTPEVNPAEWVRRVRVRMRRKDGSWLWVEKNSRPLPEEDGAVSWDSVVTTVWDVQAEVDALQSLHEAEESRSILERAMEEVARMESLGVLAGGVAHDFNNLLVAILGNTELALDGLPDNAPQRMYLDDVRLAAERAAGLTRQLLAYARRSAILSQPVDVSRLVTETLPLVRSMVSESAELRLDTANGLPLVVGDPTQLAQVVMNLVINATEALVDRRGVVAITTRLVELTHADTVRLSPLHPMSPGPFIRLEVTDSGHGMSAETISQIFEPFYSTKFTGRGLGLAAVHGIVHAHGGVIEVTSQPGTGSSFFVFLPVP